MHTFYFIGQHDFVDKAAVTVAIEGSLGKRGFQAKDIFVDLSSFEQGFVDFRSHVDKGGTTGDRRFEMPGALIVESAIV